MDEFTRKIDLVISGRTFLSSIIILTIYFTNFFGPQHKLATSFYSVLLASLILNLLLLLLGRLPERYHRHILLLHLAYDTLLVNFIVFSTGGAENPFTLLYIFIVMYSSLFLGMIGILVVTGVNCLGFMLINIIYILLFRPSYQLTDALKSLVLYAEVNLLGLILVGLLMGFLSERLRRTRLRIEQQSDRIQDLKEYNEYILASLRSGLLTTDTHYDVVKINQMGASILGEELERLLGANATELFQLDGGEQAQLRSPQREQKAVRLEKWLQLGDKPAIYMGLSISPLVMRGSMEIGYIFIFQDLTEIKQLENEIEIQKKMAAIGNLSAAIAHEIRNPLASMMGSIQVLKNQLNLDSSQSHLMDIILRESHRLDRIIANFLQFANTRKFTPRIFELQALVRETILLFQNSPEIKPGHQIAITSDVARMDFYGDPDKIKQVFWNLCTNAIKAMPTGGLLQIHCSADEKSYIIGFQDNGSGMDEEELQHMFEPFQSRFPGGLGLGMAIVYRIVSDHDGRLDVQSQPGRGTQIRLILPKNEQAGRKEGPSP